MRLQEILLRLMRECMTCSQNSGDRGEAGAQGMGISLSVSLVNFFFFNPPHSFCPSLAEFVVDLSVSTLFSCGTPVDHHSLVSFYNAESG